MFEKKLVIFTFSAMMLIGMNTSIEAKAEEPILVDLYSNTLGSVSMESERMSVLEGYYTVEYRARKKDNVDFKIDPVYVKYDPNTFTATSENTHTPPTSAYTPPVGYYFAYWSAGDQTVYTHIGGAQMLYGGQRYMNIAKAGEQRIFYPVFRPNAYYIEFNSNGGTGTMYKQTVLYDDRANLKAEGFERDGFKFIGWSTDPNSVNPEFKSRDTILNLTTDNHATITLYAIWEKEKAQDYTIKYDSNVEDPSSISGHMDDSIVEIDSDFSIPFSNYRKTGYTFSHWTKTREDNENDRLYPGDKVKNLGSAEENVTLYAQWSPINYSIQYNDTEMNGFEAYKLKLDNLSTYDQDMIYDTEDNLMPIKFEKTGYTNKQWQQTSLIGYANNALVKNLASNEGDVVDLYTNWVPNRYKIEFDANGGYGDDMGIINATYDTSVQLSKETFLRDNYVFTGWSTDKTSKNPEFKSQESVSNLTDISGGKVTLYAVWARDRLTDEIE